MAALASPGIERIIRYNPYESQDKFHRLTHKYKGFSGPVGSGKSLAMAHEALRMAVINQGLPGLVAAPTIPMLRDSTQASIVGVLEENGVPFRWHKQYNIIFLPELGSEIWFRSLDQPERLRGTNLAWFGIDELTYSKEAAFLRLQARLRHPKAKALHGFAVWTPFGFDWVYRKFIKDPADEYGVVIAKPGENTALPVGYYESLAKSYDELFHAQEVEGAYLNIHSGLCYYSFDRMKNVSETVEFNPRFPLFWALDFNLNPMCSLIGQIIPAEDPKDAPTLIVLDEIRILQSNTPEACEEFEQRTEQWRDKTHPPQLYVFGDASGKNRQTATAGSASDWNTVRSELGNMKGIRAAYKYRKGNIAVRDRVASVNTGLRNKAGDRRIIIHGRCTHLIKDLEEVSWKAGSSQIDKHSDQMMTHLSDALGYVTQEFFKAPRKPSGGLSLISVERNTSPYGGT